MRDLPCNALGKLWKKKDSDWKKMYASSTEQRDRQNSRPAHVQIKNKCYFQRPAHTQIRTIKSRTEQRDWEDSRLAQCTCADHNW